MIKLDIQDKYELHALLKALMEAKFHPDPERAIVQASPLVANVVHRVVDELEKLNWATTVDRKHRNVEWKNDWAVWRAKVPDALVLPVATRHLASIDRLEREDPGAVIPFMETLLAPFKPVEERMLALIQSARAVRQTGTQGAGS